MSCTVRTFIKTRNYSIYKINEERSKIPRNSRGNFSKDIFPRIPVYQLSISISEVAYNTPLVMQHYIWALKALLNQPIIGQVQVSTSITLVLYYVLVYIA